jgi:beta-galactosidase
MKKHTILLFAFGVAMQSYATLVPLDGFSYGKQQAPTGEEWQSPGNLALNKEQPRATFYSFADVASARKVLPENSTYRESLNGDWAFHWAPDPDSRPKEFYQKGFDASGWDRIAVPSSWNIAGIQKDGSLKYGVPIYVNQPVIFQHKVAVDDWRGGVMRTPPTNWTTFKHRNEVGSYIREVEVPQSWDGREVFINFDGVDSFFYLWINGQYVGFSKNSRNSARFDITPYIQAGTNTVAVEVYRSSDGSFLEAQDMFRLPGIFRGVELYSTPKVQIRDLHAIPTLTDGGAKGELALTAEVRNFTKKAAKGYTIAYSLFANKLYSDDNTATDFVASTKVNAVAAGQTADAQPTVLTVTNPNLWSAETPNRYTLVAELKDAKGQTIETVSTYVGFRQVEIKDTPAEQDEFGLAGRYYYVNGKTVKLKGVNRHESHPATGHALTRQMMEEEVMLMKQANINHVRNSHYTDDPYWYYLCDKYGIYLEDEANIESHEYYYGDASLSHPVEWMPAHVARVREMVRSHINHPSIVIWSLGNEAGPGHNFVAAYDSLKRDDTSRPVQYERNNDIVDMGSNQYPSISWMRGAVTGKYNIKYPFHISEYAHSMGNACGNLDDYWDAIESTNFFCGGAIWDWVDQSMYNYRPDGERYFAYGGDFGDTPNDGQFVMNGIIFGDRTPKPQYYEVKKVYQNVGVKPVEGREGEYEVFNKAYFTNLDRYRAEWVLMADGLEAASGDLGRLDVAPRAKTTVKVPVDLASLDAGKEYFVNIRFHLADDMPWAKQGYVQAEEQLPLRAASARTTVADLQPGKTKLAVRDLKNGTQLISGSDFAVVMDMKQGTIHALAYGNDSIIKAGNGPKLDAFRAFTNNDNWFYEQWFRMGLNNLQHRVLSSKVTKLKSGAVEVDFTVESQAPQAYEIKGGTASGKNSITPRDDKQFTADDFRFLTNQVWTIYPDGSVELQAAVATDYANAVLPRLGYLMRVPQQYDTFTYYGRGPIENYADRKSGQFMGQYRSTVAEQYTSFPKPQENGNHEDARWCALTDKSGRGAAFVGDGINAVQAIPYSALDMTLAGHPYQLPAPGDTYLRLDAGVTGLGGNSCGQGGPLVEDRIHSDAHRFGFVIRPVADDAALQTAVAVQASGRKPEPHSFKKATDASLKVISASSVEAGEGDADHLVDGDRATLWHTMYSVTVAKYPHWVDLDASKEQTIRGFAYLPRQEGWSGLIREYELHVSNDGQTWSEPVAKGAFDGDRAEKKVFFQTPVKARYVRFTALSSLYGDDVACAAEFRLITE